MTFLLEPSYRIAELRRNIPEDERPLMHYVIAERYLQAGQNESAVESFDRCAQVAQTVGDKWWQDAARARADELRKMLSP